MWWEQPTSKDKTKGVAMAQRGLQNQGVEGKLCHIGGVRDQTKLTNLESQGYSIEQIG